MNATFWGIVCIGFIIGWLIYYTVRRTKNFGIRTVAAVIGAIAGGAIRKFFGNTLTARADDGADRAAGALAGLPIG